MFSTDTACSQTVPLWRALIFGADGACVTFGYWTIIGGLAGFALGVMALQYIANRLLFGRSPAGAATQQPRGLRAGQVLDHMSDGET